MERNQIVVQVLSVNNVFHLGLLVYQLLDGQPCRIQGSREHLQVPDNYPVGVSSRLREVIQDCPTKDPAKRPSIQQIFFKY
jgi:hypothetical protein